MPDTILALDDPFLNSVGANARHKKSPKATRYTVNKKNPEQNGQTRVSRETGVTRFSVESPHFPPSRRPGGSSETASGFQHGHSDGMLGSSPRRPTRRLLGTQPHTRVRGPETLKKPPTVQPSRQPSVFRSLPSGDVSWV